MCSSCKKLNNIGASKIYECKCGLICDRDINSAKNIFMSDNIINWKK